MIIFAPSVDEFGGDINTEEISRFIDNGGNVLVGGSSRSGESLREVAVECGFEIDENGAAVIDHLNYDASDEGDHTTIVVSPENLISSPLIVGDKNIAPLLYRGTGVLADRDNGLTLQVMTADSTSYSYIPKNPIKEYPHSVGRGTILIAALQARNNARVVFSGELIEFLCVCFKVYYCADIDHHMLFILIFRRLVVLLLGQSIHIVRNQSRW